MQRVLLVGTNNFRFDVIDGALSHLGPKVINHSNLLARLTSIWRPELTEENAIRYSGVGDHIILSFLIATTTRKMINIVQYVKVEQIETEEEGIVVGLCTGSLLEWKDLVYKCINSSVYLNDLGQVLLKQLDEIGYSGLFANYRRKMDGNQLRLENKLL